MFEEKHLYNFFPYLTKLQVIDQVSSEHLYHFLSYFILLHHTGTKVPEV